MSSENSNDIPTGEVQDNNYISRSGEKNQPIPVQSDSTPINDPIDEVKADTDEQLREFPKTSTPTISLDLTCY